MVVREAADDEVPIELTKFMHGQAAPEAPASSPSPSMSHSSCNATSYRCGAQLDIVVSNTTYEEVQLAAVCRPATGSLCTAGQAVIDSRIYAAIRAGTCRQICQGAFLVDMPLMSIKPVQLWKYTMHKASLTWR